MANEEMYDMIVVVRKRQGSKNSYASARVHSPNLSTLATLVTDIGKNLTKAKFDTDPTVFGDMGERIADKFTETARHYLNNPKLDQETMYRAFGVDVLEEIVIAVEKKTEEKPT